MVSVRRYVIDEVARWWRQAPQEARWLLMRRVEDEKPKHLTLEELHLAAVAAELDANEVERLEAGPPGQG